MLLEFIILWNVQDKKRCCQCSCPDMPRLISEAWTDKPNHGLQVGGVKQTQPWTEGWRSKTNSYLFDESSTSINLGSSLVSTTWNHKQIVFSGFINVLHCIIFYKQIFCTSRIILITVFRAFFPNYTVPLVFYLNFDMYLLWTGKVTSLRVDSTYNVLMLTNIIWVNLNYSL